MRRGKRELVSGCRCELWLNPLSLAASAAASTGWGIWVRLREPDIKPTARRDILFSWAALTQSHLSVYYFLMQAKREVLHREKLTHGLPDVYEVPSLLIQIIFRLLSRPRIKTFLLSELLAFDWKKSLTFKWLQIKPTEDHCMCMQLYLSILAWI